ncbi:M56 family metallopeptidase [Thalassotalea sp. PS06]|uniref:M56 family metallopeptidase n=1 Tax=Thalassotalea sp. PS06 TaxID=2594005 RepID=UPI0011624991|nr:M56 family metallopeptidase [Thalassotalea sp. PS06]QDP00006.1 M56 family metallopeptidase [Thalassotalea sp. PS06]
MSPDWLNILQQLSYTLGHFLWQGLVIALVLKISLVFIDKRYAQLRYLSAVSALIACLIAPVYTFSQLIQSSPGAMVGQSLPWVQDFVQSTQNIILSQGFTKTLQISHLFAIGWLLIVSILLIKFAIEFSWAQAVRRQQVLAPTNELQQQFSRLVEQLKMTRRAQLLLSFHISSPMTLGFLKPVILLPAQLVTGLSKEQLELVLLHELVHIKRYDYAVNLAQALIELLLFFHPAVHWIGRQIRLERECICDQQVLKHKNDTLSYARLMTDLADYHQSTSDLAIAANGGELTQRVQRMLDNSNQPARWNTLIPVTFVAVLFAGLCGLSANSLWKTILGSSNAANFTSNQADKQSNVAQASIAHWLLNPMERDSQQAIADSDGLPLLESEVSLTDFSPENSVQAIIAKLSTDMVNASYDDASALIDNIKPVAMNQPEQSQPSIQLAADDTSTIADNRLANTAVDDANVEPIEVAIEPVIDALVTAEPLNPLVNNQMTVFANKAAKALVLPVMELQDDLSGQAQLLDSSQLIATTYPNLQQQAELIEAQVLKTYAPKYPKLAARRKLSKAVQVSFVIDVAGRVTQLDFEEDYQVRYFKGSISEAMKKWRFKPATLNGKPVESSMTKIFDFNLEG